MRALIDPEEPTGLLMTAVMMFVADSSDPWGLVARYVHAMAPGSYFSLSHLTDDAKPPAAVEGFRRVFDHATAPMNFRSKAEVARFFDGLELVPPYAGARPGLTYTGRVGRGRPGTGRHRRVPLAVLRGGEDPVTGARAQADSG